MTIYTIEQSPRSNVRLYEQMAAIAEVFCVQEEQISRDERDNADRRTGFVGHTPLFFNRL